MAEQYSETPHAPRVVLIAGPNGAGKSTTAPSLLKGALGVHDFVNSDVIAHGLSAFKHENVLMQAGRIMWKRLDNLASQHADMAFETTLASRTFVPFLDKIAGEHGYKAHLVFLALESPELAVQRVALRVDEGGHNVPETTVRRRFHAGLRNFFQLYIPRCETWFMYDNSTLRGPRLIARGSHHEAQEVGDEERWHALRERYSA